MRENMIEYIEAKDIIPIFSGYEVCKSNHSFGPNIRTHYLIHFCLTGKGELIDKFGKHKISVGEAFIIRPGELTTYTADKFDPWEYSWIAFYGDMADKFNTDRSVYRFPLEIGLEVRRLSQNGITAPTVFISLIYNLIYHLFGENHESANTSEKVKQYIDFHYMSAISVSGISAYFGYERSYLYRIFKSSYGIGIKEYIIKKRMESASLLLARGYSVHDTAAAVGYNDQFNFSKAYKTHFGHSPKPRRP